MAHLVPSDVTPKRKRADSSATLDPAATTTTSTFPFAPRLDILDVAARGHHESPAPDSPRSRVARDFGTLDLRDLDASVSILDFGNGTTAAAYSTAKPNHDAKRLKTYDHVDHDFARAPVEVMDYTHAKTFDVKPCEIPETPQTSFNSIISQTYSTTRREIPETPQISFTAEPNRAVSPKPSALFITDPSKLNPALDRPTNTPPPRKRSPSPVVDFYWRDSEITGHLGQDPDDDGIGINGVGFKPTPAIAYARTQKRRQQVMEWKAREARDARQKRSERRRGEARAKAEEDRKRVVRFA